MELLDFDWNETAVMYDGEVIAVVPDLFDIEDEE